MRQSHCFLACGSGKAFQIEHEPIALLVLSGKQDLLRLLSKVGIFQSMKPKLYIETTIPSYLVSAPSRDVIIAGHQQTTKLWWESRKELFDIFISQLVIDEVSAGNPEQARLRLEAIRVFPQLEIVDEAVQLAAELVKAGVFPQKASTDAAHIAVTAVHGVEYLMTWNCRHIANATIFQSVREICLQQGYAFPTICTPEELLGE
jgi:predicted nucleic acid-binding protein